VYESGERPLLNIPLNSTKLTPSHAHASPPLIFQLPTINQPVFTPELNRGTVIHALLQTLPHVSPTQQLGVAQTFVNTLAPVWDVPTRNAAVAEAMNVLQVFPQYFNHGHAEVPVSLPHSMGRIDRLVEVNGTLWVLDFKTDATVPSAPPSSYVRQVQSYCAALQSETTTPIQGAIIWTATATLMTVDVTTGSH
jgi:ATP-dependent helicase/nuclease subunit A